MYFSDTFLQPGNQRTSCIDNQTLSAGWKSGVSWHLRSVKRLLVPVTLSSRWCVRSQTALLRQNHSSTAGALVGELFNGKSGGWLPKMHWKGVIWVAECFRESWVYSSHGKKRVQSIRLLEQNVHKNRPIFWFIFYTCPFAWGWYPGVRLTVAPSFSRKLCHMWDVNCRPRSLTTFSGSSKKQKTWLNMSSANAKAVGRLDRSMRWSECENRSVITRIKVFPFDSGRSVMTSTATCDQRRFGVGKGTILPAGKWRGILALVQEEQDAT